MQQPNPSYVDVLLASLDEMARELVSSVPRIFLGLLLFLIFLVFARLVQAAVARALRRTKAGLAVEQLLSQATYLTLVFAGVLAGLAEAGVQVTTFLAGLGLTGLAVGLALKDTIENLISGIMLLIQRPFVIGDTIQVAGYEGEVVELSVRVTRLRTGDGLEVIIPNAQVFNNILVNATYYPIRRCAIQLNLAAATPIPQATKVLVDAVRNLPGVRNEPAPTVVWTALSSKAVTAELRYWTDSRQVVDGALPSQTIRAVKEAVTGSGIELA